LLRLSDNAGQSHNLMIANKSFKNVANEKFWELHSKSEFHL